MNLRKITEYIVAEPFRPFRINVASGKAYEIRHPEMIQAGKTIVKVYGPFGQNADEDDYRWHDISMVLIESLEPIEAKTPN